MDEPEATLGRPYRKEFGPFVIDLAARVLTRQGHVVPLTPKAFDLLTALIERPGELISKEELLQKVWPGTFVEESNLAYNVFALRKALGDTVDNPQFIGTVPRRGYRFTATVVPVGSENGGPAMERPAEGDTRALPSDLEATILPFRKDPARRQHPAVDLLGEPEERPVESTVVPSPVPARRISPRRRWALGGVVMLLVAGVYFAVASRRAASKPPRPVPITSLPGVVRSPSLSPDGKYVVYSWTGPKQDNPDIYIQQIDAGGPHQLTSDPRNDYGPSWSPDGRTIAFFRRGADGVRSEVWRIAPLGGPERKIADIQPRKPSFIPASVAWCPDSTCVVVTDAPAADKPDALFVVAVDTGDKRQLTTPEGLVRDSDPAISPDGRSLVFRRETSAFSSAFYRLPLDRHMMPAGAAVPLTTTFSAGKPSWTSDGREILFGSRGWLWRMDALRGGTPTRLPFIGQDGTTPVVASTSSGRQRLLYVRSFVDANVMRLDTTAPGSPAASPAVSAISTTRFESLASLSPDGQRLTYLTNRSGDSQIWAAGLDGADAFPLTSSDFRSLPGYPRWSPDGSLIAFHGDPEGRPDVLVVPARGGKVRNRTKEGRSGAFPSFSRNGQWLYFSAEVHQGEFCIWKMPVADGSPVQVTSRVGSIAIESYDGRDLYYVEAMDRPSSLWRQPLDGSAPRKLVDDVVLGNFDVTDDGIYYTDRVSGESGTFFSDRPGGETRLEYLDFATGRSTTVARNLGTLTLGLSASRDGRKIFYSRVDTAVDELMLVEDFR